MDGENKLRVHHIGYLIENMNAAIDAFEKLGYHISQNVIYDSLRKIDICFMKNNETYIELVMPREDCNLFKTLKKRIGNAPYHICYSCDDYEKDSAQLLENGWIQIHPLNVAVAINNQRVAFFYHSDVGMIELIEGEK